MNKKLKILIPTGFFVGLGLLLFWLARDNTFELLEPKGIIAEKQKGLLVFATLLSLIVVIPVYALLVFILVRYRASNKKASYKPNWDGSRQLETVWWGIPITLIFILSVVTWNSTHDLDPFKPVDAERQPLKIQVVALQWKWLFIYPEQGIATLDYVQVPKGVPVQFDITADAPMNSFWVPQLGGQIYAMSGMSSQLNLRADETGSFLGRSANISGEGFSGMQFAVESTDQVQFDAWTVSVRESSLELDQAEYLRLAEPSEDNQKLYYGIVQPDLYQNILAKYTSHGINTSQKPEEPLHDHHSEGSH